ncbi:CgeB family protein [Methylobacterium sp. JK268]
MTRPLDIVVLGLSLSSSWGNGHATTYRALLKALAARGHRISFLERDVPWYAAHRDLADPAYCDLVLYRDLAALRDLRPLLLRADAAIVGSYVPEGVAVGEWAIAAMREGGGVAGFYDIDTPVTLAKLARGDHEYLTPDLIAAYDLYLSFTGGPVLARLERDFGAPRARALYCSVDPALYGPTGAVPAYDLTYLGTYSPDRQPTLERLLIEPARRAPQLRFMVAGPQYPDTIAWPDNVERRDHVGPADHAAFYGLSRWTLNVTRADMRAAGHSPSVRLFEAAACGTPIISDDWPGLDAVLTPGREIVVAEGPEAVLRALTQMPEAERAALAEAARRRVLGAHTAAHRAAELEAALGEAMAG